MSHRILIIDDLPSIHDDYRTVLESRTYCTEMDNSLNAFLVNPKAQQQSKVAMDVEIDSLSGQQGYEMLCQALDEQRPYELAFVDMRMPPG
jgi:two-component system NtrC family sensor kinase